VSAGPWRLARSNSATQTGPRQLRQARLDALHRRPGL
jgi:hypothetical protein